MAMITCLTCGYQVSDRAIVCPQCGNNPRKKPRKKWGKKEYIFLSSTIAAVIAVGIALFFILRPDPYLKIGREYLSKELAERYKSETREKFGSCHSIADFNISELIEEEWDRVLCNKRFNIPLENDSVYSVCAYTFNAEPSDNIFVENWVPTIYGFLTPFMGKTIFVVFRCNEPVLFLTEEAMDAYQKGGICVVKKDGTSIPLDFHDELELDYIDATTTINGSSNPQEWAMKASKYIGEKYGDYDIVCSCNSVNEVKQRHNLNIADGDFANEAVEKPVEGIVGGECPITTSYDLDSRLLSHGEVASKSKTELRIMRNEIYARHGYIFKSQDLKDYFEGFSWYHGTVSNMNDIRLNRYELDNIETIKKYE